MTFVGLDDPAWDADAVLRARRRAGATASVPPRRRPRARAPAEAHAAALEPDVVHTHLVHADLYGALASVRAPWALVSTKHNDDPFRAGAFRFAERALTRRADRVVAITERPRRFCVEQGGPARRRRSRSCTTASTSSRRPGAPGAEPPEGRFLLAIARLTEQKGLDVAVRALAELPADVRLAVLGEGPERPRLEALAGELGVADRLLLPGRVGDVAAWLRRATLLVHPVALGGLRARAARGDARREAGRREPASARSRRSSSTARPACSFPRTTPGARPAPCSRCFRIPGAASGSARPAASVRSGSSRSTAWRRGRSRAYDRALSGRRSASSAR